MENTTNPRKQRGLQIALQKDSVTKLENGWIVRSQTNPNKRYFVKPNLECNCPDHEQHNVTCKHAYAVEIILKKEIDQNGNIVVTQTKKVTYPQDWKNYTPAQCNEGRLFGGLLKDLVNGIEEPEQIMGRPRLSLKDTVFCAVQKVYSQLSSRRAHSRYGEAKDKEQIVKAPNYNSINILLNREDVTPILNNLLVLSALPLKSVETTFAPDSSGFRTTKFNEYCKEKHGTKKIHKWVKAHILVGTKTNVIANARITEGTGADCPQFGPMVTEANQSGFTIKEIPADMGYSSRANYELAQSIGATAYIPFKSNANGRARGSPVWKKMYHFFQMNNEEFMKHYHARSNVESAINMVKAKFGDGVKSKNFTAQKNELLCKLIAHNVVVLIHEMYELGIKPNFGSSPNIA